MFYGYSTESSFTSNLEVGQSLRSSFRQISSLHLLLNLYVNIKSINQSIDRSIDQSINQSIKQSINQSINSCNNQSECTCLDTRHIVSVIHNNTKFPLTSCMHKLTLCCRCSQATTENIMCKFPTFFSETRFTCICGRYSITVNLDIVIRRSSPKHDFSKHPLTYTSQVFLNKI